MIDTNSLKNVLEMIECPNNIHLIKSLLSSCNWADFLISQLWERGELGDNEKYNLRARVSMARKKIIEEHKQSMKKTLNFYVVKDVDTLIDIIYDAIFG